MRSSHRWARVEWARSIGRGTRGWTVLAIKVLPPHFADDEMRRQRFEREAKVVSSLNHPNICTLYDVGRQDGVDFIVMESRTGKH